MKNIFKISALILLSNAAFAKTTALATPSASFTCPTEIICTADKRISTCKPVTDHPEYWGKIEDNSPVTKGSHAFMSAYASYQYRNIYGVSCNYDGMSLMSKYNDYLIEAKPGEGTAWQVYGYSASCYDNAESCPFSLVPSINVQMKEAGGEEFSVNITSNGIDILDYPFGSYYASARINPYQVWNGCDEKICQLDFIVNDDKGAINIGSVLVDVENKMQILKVYSTPDSGYELSQEKNSSSLLISAKNKAIKK